MQRLLKLVFLTTCVCYAQSNIGQISGNVLDSSGSAIPNAEVTLRNTGTGQTAVVRSNETGLYIFPSVPVGTYDVRADAAGFQPVEIKGVAVDAALRRSLDFTLMISTVKEALNVEASATPVQTGQGDVSAVITERQVSQIALNGRNFTQLVALLPGAVTAPGSAFNLNLSTQGQVVNGIRSASMYFTLDGGDNMANGGNSNMTVNPNVDTIAEVKILTSSYSAEFGARAGAIVNVVTKSGTRDFHGSAFEFLRNDAFDARNFFTISKAPLRFNDFGWTLGGPLFIPHKFNHDRSKLFFFAAQEWKYTHQATNQITVVPTHAEKAGDFRNSTLPAPIDPSTGQPFRGAMIPPSQFSKNGPLLLLPYPDPNYVGPGGNYSVNAPNRTDTREDTIRGDYYFSPTSQIMYRWTHDTWDIFNGYQGSNLGIVPGGRPRPGFSTIVTWTKTFSPTFLNSAGFSVTVNSVHGHPQNQILSRSRLGLTYPELFPINQYSVGPNVNIAGFAGYNAGDHIVVTDPTFMLRDDVSKIVGRHSMKFGAQFFRVRVNQNVIVNDNGVVTFNTSAAHSTGNVIADVLLGNFQTYSEGVQDTFSWGRFSQYEFYAQDNWRVNRRLTLDYGVRWQIYQPVYNVLGAFTTFIPQKFDPAQAPKINPSNGTLVPNTGNPTNGIYFLGDRFPDAAKGRIALADDPSAQKLFIGLPPGGFPIRYGNFAPRFGFAFDPKEDGKTAIRGGFGIFYDVETGDSRRLSLSNPPYSQIPTIFNGNIDNPSGGTSLSSPPALNTWSTTMNVPTVYSYNLDIQRQIWNGAVLDVGYVGTLGRRLLRQYDINQPRPGTLQRNPGVNLNALRPYPGYSSILFRDYGDSSNYNSLQVAVNQRMARYGVSYGVNYTWSKTLDTTNGQPQDFYNVRADYGLSDVHRAHVFNANYIYEIPFFRQSGNTLLRNTVGNWDIAGLVHLQSGAPNSVIVPSDIAGVGASSSRASVIGDPNLPGDQRTPAHWFNTAAFLAPSQMAPGQFGNTGRNILIGPTLSQLDLALLKNLDISERVRLQLRAEAFNFLNQTSFTAINTTLRFDSKGNPTGGFGAVTAANIGRTLSFGLKLMF